MILKLNNFSWRSILRFTGILQRRQFGQPAATTHPHLVQDGEVTPGLGRGEYYTRRHNLIERIAEAAGCMSKSRHHVVVIPSATKMFMTHDIPYTFRQNTDFLYLCGFQEPDSVLVLMGNPGELPSHKAVLFVPKKDPHKELWEGPRSGRSGAVELTGVDQAENSEDLSCFLSSYLKGHRGNCSLWYNHKKPAHMIFHYQYINDILKAHHGVAENPTPLIQDLRLVKSSAEAELMKRSNDIAGSSFAEVMRFSHPGVQESHLYAKMDFECRIRDAEYLAYPPVVAGGNRANTIHYINNNQIVEDGEMVLMDAGCEYHGYASDITRTWPVSGEFTASQRVLYEVVLEVQQHCIQMCNLQSMTLNQLFQEMLRVLGERLLSAGVIPGHVTGSEQQALVRQLCPHHVGHYLGMDVHDTDGVSRGRMLTPGTVVTIEPGVYIPHTMADVPKDFHGNGLRIEDNILITESGYTNLTENCPKDPDQIEAIVKGS